MPPRLVLTLLLFWEHSRLSPGLHPFYAREATRFTLGPEEFVPVLIISPRKVSIKKGQRKRESKGCSRS